MNSSIISFGIRTIVIVIIHFIDKLSFLFKSVTSMLVWKPTVRRDLATVIRLTRLSKPPKIRPHPIIFKSSICISKQNLRSIHWSWGTNSSCHDSWLVLPTYSLPFLVMIYQFLKQKSLSAHRLQDYKSVTAWRRQLVCIYLDRPQSIGHIRLLGYVASVRLVCQNFRGGVWISLHDVAHSGSLQSSGGINRPHSSSMCPRWVIDGHVNGLSQVHV